MDEQKLEIVIISSLDNFGIEGLLLPIRVSILSKKEVDIAMRNADTYYIVCKLKKA